MCWCVGETAAGLVASQQPARGEERRGGCSCSGPTRRTERDPTRPDLTDEQPRSASPTTTRHERGTRHGEDGRAQEGALVTGVCTLVSHGRVSVCTRSLAPVAHVTLPTGTERSFPCLPLAGIHHPPPHPPHPAPTRTFHPRLLLRLHPPLSCVQRVSTRVVVRRVVCSSDSVPTPKLKKQTRSDRPPAPTNNSPNRSSRNRRNAATTTTTTTTRLLV